MNLPLFSHRCKGSADCEACQSTVSMERVCSLSSPESTLSTSSSASAQSSASPRKHPNRYDRCNSTAIFILFYFLPFIAFYPELQQNDFRTPLLFTHSQYVRRRTGERLWHGGQLARLGCLWPRHQSLCGATLHPRQQSELRAPCGMCRPRDRAQQANCSYGRGTSDEGAEQQQ